MTAPCTAEQLAEITGEVIREHVALKVTPLIAENARLRRELSALAGRVADLEEQATNP
jgi:hypothetical protein